MKKIKSIGKKSEEKFPFQPEDNRVIICPLPTKEQKTKQGIIIPGTSKEMPRGLVMAISREYTGSAKVGDTVIYTENSAVEKSCVIVYKHDILAIVL
jgi:co-chaperonin GroES (HSP10)